MFNISQSDVFSLPYYVGNFQKSLHCNHQRIFHHALFDMVSNSHAFKDKAGVDWAWCFIPFRHYRFYEACRLWSLMIGMELFFSYRQRIQKIGNRL